MEYQSEIRDSEINELLEKVERRNYQVPKKSWK